VASRIDPIGTDIPRDRTLHARCPSMATAPRPRTTRPGLLDIIDLASRLGVTERFIRRLIHERRIPYYKVGHLVRFDAADIDRWLALHRIEPPQQTRPPRRT
jgi:excisionase family DNA binding protein